MPPPSPRPPISRCRCPREKHPTLTTARRRSAWGRRTAPPPRRPPTGLPPAPRGRAAHAGPAPGARARTQRVLLRRGPWLPWGDHHAQCRSPLHPRHHVRDLSRCRGGGWLPRCRPTPPPPHHQRAQHHHASLLPPPARRRRRLCHQGPPLQQRAASVSPLPTTAVAVVQRSRLALRHLPPVSRRGRHPTADRRTPTGPDRHRSLPQRRPLLRQPRQGTHQAQSRRMRRRMAGQLASPRAGAGLQAAAAQQQQPQRLNPSVQHGRCHHQAPGEFARWRLPRARSRPPARPRAPRRRALPPQRHSALASAAAVTASLPLAAHETD